eukprot:10034384-Ditylum_brightwellii.AAC.1
MIIVNFVGIGAEDRVQQWNKKLKQNSTITARKDMVSCMISFMSSQAGNAWKSDTTSMTHSSMRD